MDKKLGHTKVKVVVRVRPALAASTEGCVKVTHNKVSIQNHRNKEENLQYEFSSVYSETATQSDVFSDCVQPLLASTLQGQNVSIFAYGPTGAGKTHTMLGVASDPGIIPRVVRELFTSIEVEAQPGGNGQNQPQHTVTFSYMEIYNEKVQDLLSGKQDLPIREDSNHNIFVAGITEKSINSFETFQSLFEPASCNRTVAATKLNEYSSRSHSILMIKVIRKLQAKQYIGKIYLIDLAGSEDNRRTGNRGIRLKESGAINKSLFVLGEVVDAINNNLARIPYRNSKLTRLLQDSIGGSCQSVMITNIAPEPCFYYDTYCTLNFATKSKKVVNVSNVHVQEEPTPSFTKPTATVKPYKRRSSLIPVTNGKRPRTSLPSQTEQSTKYTDEMIVCLPSPIVRCHKELERRLETMDQMMKEFERKVRSRTGTEEGASSWTELSNTASSQPSRSPRHTLATDGSGDSPDVVFSTPSIKSGKLVDITNCLIGSPVKVAGKRSKLTLKKQKDGKEKMPSSSPKGSSFKPARRRNSDLTPVRQKILQNSSTFDHPVQFQRGSDFLDVLNKASVKELQQLQTVGIKRAKYIYEWRQIHGNFDFIDGLKQIPSFTDKYIQNLLRRNLVTS